jgi:hypothetical protein
MYSNAGMTVAVGISLFSAISANGATGEQTEVAELRQRVAELESRLSKIDGAEEGWLTEQRAQEIRNLVQDVLADADTRASLLQSGMTGGWDKGFFLASPDGNYRLGISGQIQIRYVYNLQDDNDVDGDDHRQGFEHRRAKLEFKGHVVDKTWRYEFQPVWSRTGAGSIENIYVDKDLGNGWSVKFGQFKGPLLHEELVSSKRQLAVDRSIVNESFNQDYNEGVQVAWRGDTIGAYAMWHDGMGNTGVTPAPGLGNSGNDNTAATAFDVEWAMMGRVEWVAAGDWKQFDDFTSWKGDQFGLLVGAAANWESSEYGTTAGPEVESLTLTADASVEFGGANLFGAFIYRNLDNDAAIDADQIAFVIQGGIHVVPDDIEIFGRFEWGDADLADEEELTVVTVGVNKYFNKHNLKWTTDFGYSFNELTGFWTRHAEGIGYRAGDTEEGQMVFRSQFQLLF